jgi:hypothetical protein
MPNKPPADMSLAEVRAELQAVTGKPWADEAELAARDGARQQALWQRLDALAAAGGVADSHIDADAESAPAPTQRASEGESRSEPDPLPSPAKPPDLHELIDRFGGYGAIPPDAWAAFDRALAEWKQARGIGTGLPGKKSP